MNPLLKERSILLVEDNPGDARLIVEMLRDAESGLTLRSVGTLASALDAAASDTPDAVILDLGLPDSDGLATFSRLQEAVPGVAVIILSGNVDSRTALQAVQEGAQDFLVKDHLNGDMLLRSVGYAIERKNAEWSLRVSEDRLRRNLEITGAIADVSTALISQTLPIEEIAGLILSTAREVTGSEHGYVAHIDVATGDHQMLAATPMGPEVLTVGSTGRSIRSFPIGPGDTYPRLWGVSLNTGRPLLANDPSQNVASEGTPPGHAVLTRFLSVPVTTSAGVVGQIAVANAPGDYDAVEVDALERLAALFAVAVLRHESDAELRRSEVDLQTSNERLESMIGGIAETMGSVVEARDPYTQGHQVRVARIAFAIGAEMALPEDQLACIRMAGLLHDIGKLSIPTEILSKPGKLSEAEFALIREHPTGGREILAKIAFPWPIADIVAQHHERCDGSGYPRGLFRGETRLEARILAVADVLEAMSSYRPYRAALGVGAALAEVTGASGKYDEDIVAAVVALHDRQALEL